MKIGIIGGGQLAQMMALAGYPLGLKVICLESTKDCPAGLVTDIIIGQYDNLDALNTLADQVDILTYEFENISSSALEQLEQQTNLTHKKLYPSAAILKISQDRLQEKYLFEHLHIPTTQYAPVDSLTALKKAAHDIGLPAVLKTRCLGYDGKGQAIIKHYPDIEAAWETLKDQPLILENKVNFDREVSCIGVRNIQGDIYFYALTENQHKNGILHLSHVVQHDQEIEKLAQDYVTRILKEFNYVGVLTVEFFQKDQALIANEIAPRVHNSGHWTIEGADTSQFENHLRAVCNLPLGSTRTRDQVAMLNLVGKIPDLEKMLKILHAHCHLYGKTPREGRKLGHVTLCVDNENIFQDKLVELLQLAE